MLTLAQWRRARRVDLFARVRFRGDSDPHLKAFDDHVEAYHHVVNANYQDKVGIIGKIMNGCHSYLGATRKDRYRDVIVDLREAAGNELGALILGQRAPNVRMEAALGMRTGLFTPKTVLLNCFVVRRPSDAASVAGVDTLIDEHIENANEILSGARVTIVRNPARQATTTVTQVDPKGSGDLNSILHPKATGFDDHGRGRMSAYFAREVDHAVSPHTINVVYVPNFAAALAAQGVTTRPSTTGISPAPARPFVTVSEAPVHGPTYPTTLAHELVHVLTGSPDHSGDSHNLMAEGAMRTGTNRLSLGQIALLHASRFTV